MAKDPVCGMQVNEQQAAGSSEQAGRTYYFCSAQCKRTFDEDPSRYTGAPKRGFFSRIFNRS